MKTRTGFSIAVLAAAILMLLPIAPAVQAQDQDQYQGQEGNYADPPTRAGRIGLVQGSVSFQPGGQGDWLEAVPNRPLTTGDNLWVDKDSRAEIQVGSTSIRLGPQTSLTFLELGDNVTQLRLSVGSVFFRVRHFGGDDAFEVDTPNLAFNVSQPGEFRLDVNEDGDQTVATVWNGEGEVSGGGDSYRLFAGQQGEFTGVDRLSYNVGQIAQPDDFGQWAMSRDEREDRVQSRAYVSDEMTGYEDLDDYGQWHEAAGYGNVWTPVGVAVDWAPYRYGHWVFVSPWGWTWVEQEPWGFAPFHYGRWAFVESRWCWVPGPVAVRPVYSPALVAFIGGGGGFHIGVGVGVGWFPLGPGEVFVPWYRTSPRYVQNVNITNTRVNVVQVTNVYNNVTVNHVNNITYVNQRVTNSVTVVNHDTFVNARPVHDNIVRVDQKQVWSAPVGREAVSNIRPVRQSEMGAGRPAQMRPPEQVTSRPVVATRQPVVFARPVPVQGAERATPAPPVKMVRMAPVNEARPLQSGPASGGPRPGMSNPPDNNRGGFTHPGDAVPQSGARGNNPRQGDTVPRPPCGDCRKVRSGSRWPCAETPSQDNAPSSNNARPNNAGQEQGIPANSNVRPETPRPQIRQDPNAGSQNARPQENTRPMPEAAPRAPETREQSAPPPPRQDAAPAPRPQPEMQREPAPRPEARPAEPPPQRESHQVEQKTEKPAPPPKEQKPPKEDKPPQKFR